MAEGKDGCTALARFLLRWFAPGANSLSVLTEAVFRIFDLEVGSQSWAKHGSHSSTWCGMVASSITLALMV